MSWVNEWLSRKKAFWRGPRLHRGAVIRYARALIRVSSVRFDKKTAQWRYRIEGSTGLDYSEEAILGMQQDYVSFMLKKEAGAGQSK